MQALKILSRGHAAPQPVPLPALRPTYILVKTHAVALNPADVAGIDLVAPIGATPGLDFAGVVVDIGSEVTKKFKVGDRVFGAVHGCNEGESEDGAFGEYLVSKGDLTGLIPENLGFEAASTLGAGIASVGQALGQNLGLPWPGKQSAKGEKVPVLIYGGSSATGALAIQFAKASGLEVITTCSPHNNNYIKSLGASAVFDYHSSTCAEDIRAHTKDSLYYVFNCLPDDSAAKICTEALSSHPRPDGSKPAYTGVSPRGVDAAIMRDDVQHSSILGYTAKGEAFTFAGNQIPAMPDHFEFMKPWLELGASLVADGTVKPHAHEVRPGGLEGVLKGLDELRGGKISAKKLVYRIGEDV
ncbi:alcohol dehydrogenase class-3 [Lophium mytilinum]|uniref:Alcohol dehydrogenase class-3 n=1 Tax=Lophium mytilinum TaxID=390894 RepID=A0A6A6QQ13_9PEZI|nr:alcohol dehydrogenase class-3 [Lophium mytilinum]